MIIVEKSKLCFLLNSEDPLVEIFNSKSERKISSNKSNVIPIYCYRHIGIKDNEKNYLDKVRALDAKLRKFSCKYLKFTQGLNKKFSNEEIESAKKVWIQYLNWENSEKRSYIELYNIEWNSIKDDNDLNWTIKRNFQEIIQIFDSTEQNINPTIRMNFGISIIMWINMYIKHLFSNELTIKHIPKLIFWGSIKRNEVYFLIYISKLGCDVLYITPTEDKEFSRIDSNQVYSKLIEYNKKIEIGDFPHANVNDEKDIFSKNTTSSKIDGKTLYEKQNKNLIEKEKNDSQIEKSFEDLAKLSESIVMINVYNKDIIPCGCASGVAIDENGLIITNYHVVKNGSVFGIVFENDNSEFITYDIIKLNEESDLALLRINRKTNPIPIKVHDNLRRGQQIVAIGSPLGFMNTISDGIVAGFRNIVNQNYIQITAPISPGSSGGALLDKYGYLVGITTGGYNEAQNINLAVPSCEIIRLIGSGL